MKFFHLSDLHIGLKLMNRDLRQDQEYILNQIIELAQRERPDAMVIAGDIYDKAIPSAEAVEVFDRFIRDVTECLPDMTIMAISGNHDSAPRVDYFRNVLARQRLYMIGIPPKNQEDTIEKVTLQDEYGNVNFYLLPFVKPSMVKVITDVDKNGNNLSYNEAIHRLIEREAINPSERNVLVSHQFYLPVGKTAEDIERADSEIRTVGNIDQVWGDVLERFDYAALGHLHKPMKVGSEYARYCGSPLACSVSEAGQQKGIVMVELMGKEMVEAEKEWTKTIGGEAKKTEKTETEAIGTGKTEIETEEAEKEAAMRAQVEILEIKRETGVRIQVLPLHPFRQVRIIRGQLEEVLEQACDDYVTVVLTDQVDFNIMDMQDRIRTAFPYLLEIRREGMRMADYRRTPAMDEVTDPFELCCRFLKEVDDKDQEILRDVIHTVLEVK